MIAGAGGSAGSLSTRSRLSRAGHPQLHSHPLLHLPAMSPGPYSPDSEEAPLTGGTCSDSSSPGAPGAAGSLASSGGGASSLWSPAGPSRAPSLSTFRSHGAGLLQRRSIRVALSLVLALVLLAACRTEVTSVLSAIGVQLGVVVPSLSTPAAPQLDQAGTEAAPSRAEAGSFTEASTGPLDLDSLDPDMDVFQRNFTFLRGPLGSEGPPSGSDLSSSEQDQAEAQDGAAGASCGRLCTDLARNPCLSQTADTPGGAVDWVDWVDGGLTPEGGGEEGAGVDSSDAGPELDKGGAREGAAGTQQWQWSSRAVKCGFKYFSGTQALEALQGKHLLFAGDSQSRKTLEALMRLLYPAHDIFFPKRTSLTFDLPRANLRVDYLFSPYPANLTAALGALARSGECPDVLALGAGLWHMLWVNNPLLYQQGLEAVRRATLRFLASPGCTAKRRAPGAGSESAPGTTADAGSEVGSEAGPEPGEEVEVESGDGAGSERGEGTGEGSGEAGGKGGGPAVVPFWVDFPKLIMERLNTERKRALLVPPCQDAYQAALQRVHLVAKPDSLDASSKRVDLQACPESARLAEVGDGETQWIVGGSSEEEVTELPGPFLDMQLHPLSLGCGDLCAVDGMHYNASLYDAAVQILLNLYGKSQLKP